MATRETLVRLFYRLAGKPTVAGALERLSAISQRRILGKLLTDLRVDCVIDVGANEGQYARLLRRLGFQGQILSFEPNPDVFEALRLSMRDDPAWKGFNFGLGSADAEIDFNIFEDSQVSSFLPASKRLSSKLLKSVRLPIRRFDVALPEILPDWKARRLFLKCDTQGFDLEVVKGSEAVTQAIFGLQSEIAVQSLYAGMPRYLEALQFYESQGFVLIDLWLNNRTLTGGALEYDCLMRREGTI